MQQKTCVAVVIFYLVGYHVMIISTWFHVVYYVPTMFDSAKLFCLFVVGAPCATRSECSCTQVLVLVLLTKVLWAAN